MIDDPETAKLNNDDLTKAIDNIKDRDDFRRTAKAIAKDLEAYQPAGAFSVASLTVELKTSIRSARARGASFKDIARIYGQHGCPTEPDTIRIALGRNVVTRAARGRKAIQVVIPDVTHAAETSSITNTSRKKGANLAPRLR